jgi:hypothetical protein
MGEGEKKSLCEIRQFTFQVKKKRNFGEKDNTDIEGYVTYYFDMLGEVMSAKHAWVSLEKIGKGQLGRLEE